MKQESINTVWLLIHHISPYMFVTWQQSVVVIARQLPKSVFVCLHTVYTFLLSLLRLRRCAGPLLRNFVKFLDGYFRRIYAVGYQQPSHHFLIETLPDKISLCHWAINSRSICCAFPLLTAPWYSQYLFPYIFCRVNRQGQICIRVFSLVLIQLANVNLQNFGKVIIGRNKMIKRDAVIVNFTSSPKHDSSTNWI